MTTYDLWIACARFCEGEVLGLLFDAEQLTHFFIQEAAPGPIRLYPFPVNDELRNRALTDVLDEVVGRFRRAFNVHFFERNVVFLEEILGLAAIAAPERSVDGQIHGLNGSKNLLKQCSAVVSGLESTECHSLRLWADKDHPSSYAEYC